MRLTYKIKLSNKTSCDMNTTFHAKYHKNTVTQWTDRAINNFGDTSYAPSYLYINQNINASCLMNSPI